MLFAWRSSCAIASLTMSAMFAPFANSYRTPHVLAVTMPPTEKCDKVSGADHPESIGDFSRKEHL
jgi:hypothetical protein